MRARTLGAAVVLVVAVGFATGAPAHAAVPGCGMVITTNTTLTSDIGPCPENGIVIAASNVRLDLGGHTVSGRSRLGDGIGVLFDNVSGSRLVNGTVRTFAAGVEIRGGGHNKVEGIAAANNVGGAGPAPNLGDGITIQLSSFNTVTGNTATGNGPYSGISVVDNAARPRLASTGNVITNNIVVGNNIDVPGVPVDQDDGIRIEGPHAEATVITGNTVAENGLDGIAVFADQATGFPNIGTAIVDNVVAGNGFHPFSYRKGDGIILFGAPGNPAVMGANNSLVRLNKVQHNAGDGIAVASTSNVIARNVATGNAAYPGVTNWDLRDLNVTPPCDNNRWSNNRYGTANQSCIG